jgi:hypothetical protein
MELSFEQGQTEVEILFTRPQWEEFRKMVAEAEFTDIKYHSGHC